MSKLITWVWGETLVRRHVQILSRQSWHNEHPDKISLVGFIY